MRIPHFFSALKPIALLCLLLGTIQAKAQFSTAAAYPFTASNKPFSYLTGGTPITFGNNDDGYASIPIGFSFPFCGGTYTTAYVSTNGWISFTPQSWSSNWNSTGDLGTIAPCI